MPTAHLELVPPVEVTGRRKFLPAHFVPADLTVVAKMFDLLDARALPTTAAVEQWLQDASELLSAVDEYGARAYISRTCDTTSEAKEKAYMSFIETIEPAVKPRRNALQTKFLTSPAGKELTGPRYTILRRSWQSEADLYRAENVALDADISGRVVEYDKLCAAMKVELDGKTYTLPQAAKFSESTDAAVRERAWRAVETRRLADREKIETIFDEVLPIRQQVAVNAGHPDYRSYTWAALKRFDYTVDHCKAFQDAVEKTVVPALKLLHARRQKALGLKSLRPWDVNVDPLGRQPLKPFDTSDEARLIGKCQDIFTKLDPQLGRNFGKLNEHKYIDLLSRDGKAPGGYQSTLEESGEPFIFMNAAGMHRDVTVLLHEGGHAFHAQAAAAEPLVFLRSAPMEFCEVASMGMELLGNEFLEEFYGPADADRARQRHLIEVLEGLPWIATIDAFQHWLYTHPGHSRAERSATWVSLMNRFKAAGVGVDYAGLEENLTARWQAQLHLFHLPFYYIEYGIAQLGALQLWMKAREDPQRALANYQAALKLGGTRPLPELFTAAGLSFDFSEKTIRPLVQAVLDEIGPEAC